MNNKSEEIEINFNFKDVDENYFDLFDIELIAGKNLSSNSATGEVVISKAALKEMGIEDPNEALGRHFKSSWGSNYIIIGVCNDFNTNTLHETIKPVLFQYRENMFYELSIKLKNSSTNSIAATTGKIEKLWEEVYPEYVMSYDFFDELIERRYRAEKSSVALLELFAAISIFIGSLGLYGLIDFMAIKKTKEIGIRKVLGASSYNILSIFLKEISILVILSICIACPIMYYLLNMWLESFAYRIDIGIGVFLLALFTVTLMAVITTGIRSIKASLVNPVDTLKDE